MYIHKQHIHPYKPTQKKEDGEKKVDSPEDLKFKENSNKVCIYA